MKQMKKLLAVLLAFAMIITIYQPSAVYAATKKPTLSAKTMTLQAGQKKTLKVKNAGKKAILKWSSNKKSIAAVSKKGTVKAVKAGKANITCKVVTKTGKSYKLVCKVTVTRKKVTSMTVTSQDELVKALKNKDLRKLTVSTQGAVTFTIPEGDYSKVDLVINAPNADVENNGVFKSIDIQAIKPNTYTENAKGNTITVSANADARVIIAAGASVANITVSQSGGTIKLVVDGAVSGITIDAPVNIVVEGTTTTAVPVTVSENAAGAKVESSTPVEVKTAAKIDLTLTKGAEGSKVETVSDNAEVTVKNGTTEAVTVKTPAGEKSVDKNTSSKVDNTGKVTNVADNNNSNNNGNTSNSGNTSTGGSSSNGGSTSGGGSSSGGSATPTETVSIYPKVVSRSAIQVYIKDTHQNIKDFSIVNANGVSQNISEIEKANENGDNYQILVASGFEDGIYSISAVYGNKQYKGKFSVAQSDFEKVEKDKAIVEELLKKAYAAPKNANPVMCKEILQETMDQELGKYAVGVYTEDEDIASDGTVNIIVNIEINNTWCKVDAKVKFELTGDEIKADPTKVNIAGYTQSSVVVKAQDYLEYTCVKQGEALTDNLVWYDFSDKDKLGNIEIADLSSDVAYDLYVKVTGTEASSAVKVNAEAISLKDKDQLICVAEADENQKNIQQTVNTGSAIKIPLKGLKAVYYGKNPAGTGFHGEFSISSDNKDLEEFLYHNAQMNNWDEDGNVLVEFSMPEDIKAGTYTLTINYKFMCSYKDENGHWISQGQIASENLKYTIQLTVE